MPELVDHETQEFWRPPAAQGEAPLPLLAAACGRCGSEFMVGARFCHGCGASRTPRTLSSVELNWRTVVDNLRGLEFQNVKRWLGLSTASMVAFLLGVGCVLSAMIVGLFYSVQSLADFQAIQLWRIQWLLAALAAFVAGILLKRPETDEK